VGTPGGEGRGGEGVVVVELTFGDVARSYKDDVNPSNPLGHQGVVAAVFAHTLKQLWNSPQCSAVQPVRIKSVIGRIATQFSGYEDVREGHACPCLVAWWFDSVCG